MTLSLFFTRGVSLYEWIEKGLFDREKLIYETHLRVNNIDKVYWLTYGSDDKQLSEELKKDYRLHKDIEVIPMPAIFNIPKIGTILYSIMLPFIQRIYLKESQILKTNQIDGSWSAVLSKFFYRKKLIIRTGYTFSQLEFNKYGRSFKYLVYSLIERFAYKFCDISVVTSIHNKVYLKEKKLIVGNKIFIIPNFIDLNLFKPDSKDRFQDKILFVGRLNGEKNLYNLIDAISHTEFTLDIYGQGALEEELKLFAVQIKAKVNFMGTVPNHKLPVIYNSYKYYILPSAFEGMPKTLLEAMACGCICIGTDTTGINEVINHNENGYLINDVSADNIYSAIKYAVSNASVKISENAVLTMQKRYSLDSVVESESMLFRDLECSDVS